MASLRASHAAPRLPPLLDRRYHGNRVGDRLRAALVQRMYDQGARNCELHLAQVRGSAREPDGVVFPTFLPETG